MDRGDGASSKTEKSKKDGEILHPMRGAKQDEKGTEQRTAQP
jgi:hypothetical protein